MAPTGDENGRPVAYVTGASVGIGQAIAARLARLGYDLVITGRTSGSLAETQVQCEGLGARVLPQYFDVSDISGSARAFEEAAEGTGPIEVLVNNAAIPLLRPAIEVNEEEWDSILGPNLKGAYFMSQSLARHLSSSNRKGCIVNIASTHGIVALKDRSVYGIAKAGMIHMTRMLAVEWADLGITVNCVAPATVSTPSREKSLADPTKRRFMLDRIPLGRFGASEEVAGAVAYLVSKDAAFTTGQTIVLDGGLTSV